MGRRAVQTIALAGAVLFAFFLWGAPPCRAGDDGPDLPARMEVDGRSLHLMGTAYRRVTIFSIAVYEAGLYLEKEGAALTGGERPPEAPRAMILRFVYSRVDGEEIREAWRDSLLACEPAPPRSLRPRLEEFISFFDREVLKGDRVTLAFLPGRGTAVIFNGVEAGVIPGADFADALFAVWLGPFPVDDRMKESLLGGAGG